MAWAWMQLNFWMFHLDQSSGSSTSLQAPPGFPTANGSRKRTHEAFSTKRQFGLNPEGLTSKHCPRISSKRAFTSRTAKVIFPHQAAGGVDVMEAWINPSSFLGEPKFGAGLSLFPVVQLEVSLLFPPPRCKFYYECLVVFSCLSFPCVVVLDASFWVQGSNCREVLCSDKPHN